MTRLKGRHLGFLGLLCLSWAAARVVIVGFEGAEPEGQEQPIAARKAPDVATAGQPLAATMATASYRSCCLPQSIFQRHRAMAAFGRSDDPMTHRDLADATVSGFANLPTAGQPDNIIGSALPTAPTRMPKPPADRHLSLRADAYAYSFWREGSGRSSLAAGGQYGGSQSGVIATFSLQRHGDVETPQRLALLVRAAVAHDDIDEREAALGIRLRPLDNLPVSLTAERRFRHDRKDAFAIYASGGVSEVEAPMKFRIDSFAQAGVVSGKKAGPFFDAFVRADRKMVEVGGIHFHAGAGAWAGGQRRATRLDIGPSLRADVRIGETQVRLNADWRFRVAGDAKPGSGPALTLSTGF